MKMTRRNYINNSHDDSDNSQQQKIQRYRTMKEIVHHSIMLFVFISSSFLQFHHDAIYSTQNTNTLTNNSKRISMFFVTASSASSSSSSFNLSRFLPFSSSNNHNNNSNYHHPNSKKNFYEIDDMISTNDPDDNSSFTIHGLGREIDLFQNSVRGGADAPSAMDLNFLDGSTADFNNKRPSSYSSISYRKRPSQSSSPSSSPFYPTSPRTRRRATPKSNNNYKNNIPNYNNNGLGLSSLRDWLSTMNLPKIQCRVEPNTTLKVRKTFKPLKTIVRLGADFNTQLGVWQFKSSWEDSIIGGKLTLAGRELQFSKTWLLSVGAVEDLVTRLRLRAAVDLGTMKAYARLGFRTERLSPINVVEGFTLMKRVPLDGMNGHVKLEVKANFAFPEPEIEYSTESHRSFVGMGDIEINIDELNLLLDY